MGRPSRAAFGGLVYHVLNRSNARVRIFDNDSDYKACEHVMLKACESIPMRNTLLLCDAQSLAHGALA
jgi:hypothetical protein